MFRDVSGIRGFSRETLVALVANIESREWRRRYLESKQLPEEHPRASTTDDVECFFSILRDSVGKDFTLKEVCHFLGIQFNYIFPRCYTDGEKSLVNS